MRHCPLWTRTARSSWHFERGGAQAKQPHESRPALGNFIGELMALGAAFSFCLASTTYTLAGRKFGASVSMALSLAVSLIFLLPLHQALYGEFFPMAASGQRWLLLGASSLAGFVMSALFLLRAFQMIGPRLTMLLGATSPIFAALLAWLLLGQRLPPYAALGIALVLAGVLTVVSGDAQTNRQNTRVGYRRGLLMALAAAVMQGTSYVLMAEGVTDDFPVMSASIMRTVFALVVLWLAIVLRGNLQQNLRLIVDQPLALFHIALAALTGPVLGATLVLASLQFTSVGISSTLTGTTPILMLPIGFVVFGDYITKRAISGTCVAVTGVALLFAA
ncbi:MAG: DMT family transporter [Chloroflexi bacterium]|nr:DMT family transporter [Chloroflexota bacterium]